MIVRQGQRSPFADMEQISNYDWYKVNCWIGRKTPAKKKRYDDIMETLSEHACKNWRKINERKKKYKCYAHR